MQFVFSLIRSIDLDAIFINYPPHLALHDLIFFCLCQVLLTKASLLALAKFILILQSSHDHFLFMLEEQREIKDVYGQEGRPVWDCITFLGLFGFFKTKYMYSIS